jgi:DNA polymerase-3 subunit epsilon
MKTFFFDTETTGLVSENKPPLDPGQPMPVQLGFKLDAHDMTEMSAGNVLIQTNTCASFGPWIVNPKAAEVTGIDNKIADEYGVHLISAVEIFLDTIALADTVVAHNINFDKVVMRRAMKVYCDETGQKYSDPFEGKKMVCTMFGSQNIVKAMPKRRGQWKWPKLEEAMKHFFNESIEGAHDALVDVRATARVYYQLIKIGAFNDDHTTNL